MKASRVKDEQSYYCPNCCESFSEEDYTTDILWKIDNYYTESCDCCGDTFFTREPDEISVWRCNNDCTNCDSDGPEIEETWICGNCESKHAGKERAGDCCQ